jgi:hypothetical protein
VLTCGEIASFCDRLLAFDAVSDAELRCGYKPADKMAGCLTFCLCGMLWPPLMPSLVVTIIENFDSGIDRS